MKCKIIEDLLPLYIEEVCSDETAEMVKEHLNSCESCRRKKEKLQAEFVVKEEIEYNLNEKELFASREKTIRHDVYAKVMRGMASVDIILIALILGLLTGKFVGELGVSMALIRVWPMLAIGFAFVIWDIIYLRGSRCGKDMVVSEMIVLLSFGIKYILPLVLGVVYLLARVING